MSNIDIDEFRTLEHLLEDGKVNPYALLALFDTGNDNSENNEIIHIILQGVCPAIMAYTAPFYNKESHYTSTLTEIA